MRFARLSDPLLAATKLATTAMKVALGIGFAAVVVALPLAHFNQDAIAVELAKEGKAIPIDSLIGGLALLLPLIAVLVAMAYGFVHLLGRIVDTVGDGDPFIPANADRLRAMGWLTLAMQVMTWPIAIVAGRIARAVEDSPSKIDTEVSFTALILVLILFVLARVFRKGAAMREELEGTV